MVVAPSGCRIWRRRQLDEPGTRPLLGVLFKNRRMRQSQLPAKPDLRWPSIDKWIIEYLADQKLIVPDRRHCGQPIRRRLGRDRAIEPERIPAVRAGHHVRAAGRGGRVGGKPNNNCAPDKLVAARGQFRTYLHAAPCALDLQRERDVSVQPYRKECTRPIHEASGSARYHLLPPFGNDGHFLIDSPDAIPLWAPLVGPFLDKHR